MGSFIQRIGILAATVKGWIFLFGSVFPAGWALVSGILEGLPTAFIIFLTAGTLAFGTCLSYYLIVGYDYTVRYLGRRRELIDAAEQLQKLLDVNHTVLRVEDITGLWAGDQANKWNYNAKLRRLKSAARAGKIKIQDRAGEKVNQLTKGMSKTLSNCLRMVMSRGMRKKNLFARTYPQLNLCVLCALCG